MIGWPVKGVVWAGSVCLESPGVPLLAGTCFQTTCGSHKTPLAAIVLATSAIVSGEMSKSPLTMALAARELTVKSLGLAYALLCAYAASNGTVCQSCPGVAIPNFATYLSQVSAPSVTPVRA